MISLVAGRGSDGGSVSVDYRQLASLTVVSLLWMLMATSAGAEERRSLYIGASIGSATYENHIGRPDCSTCRVLQIDETDKRHKLTAGLRTSERFGLEISYMDLGTHTVGDPNLYSSPFSVVESDMTSLAASVLGFVPYRQADLFARAGVVHSKSDRQFREAIVCMAGLAPPCPPFVQSSREETDRGYLLGVGVQWHYGNLGLVTEYERLKVGDRTGFLSIGVNWYFR